MAQVSPDGILTAMSCTCQFCVPALAPGSPSTAAVWNGMVTCLGFNLETVVLNAGPGTKTQQELWKTVNSGTALSASSAQTFNQQASALQKRLNSQSGGSIQLVIANAIWTKDLAVRKSYADEMKTQYNVRGAAEA